MSVLAGPKIPKKDLCCVVDARNPAIHSGSTTTIINTIEKQNNLTAPNSNIATVEDDVAGTSFSFVSSNYAYNNNWTPVINKYNFSVICWIKYQAGQDNNYTHIWKNYTTDNPAHGYYFQCDTRQSTNKSILQFVKDYATNDWATDNTITNTEWTDSTTWFQIALTISQESEFKTYLNGKIHNTVPTTTEDLTSYGNIDQFHFGPSYSTSGARCGHFSIYRRALTGDEILENYMQLRSRFGL